MITTNEPLIPKSISGSKQDECKIHIQIGDKAVAFFIGNLVMENKEVLGAVLEAIKHLKKEAAK